MNGVRTINVEDFQNGVFLRITKRQWGARAKVKDPAKLVAYLAQLATEQQAETDTGEAAVVAVESAPSRVTAKNATKTTVALIQSKPYNDLCAYMNEEKARLVGPFGKANPSRIAEGVFVVSKAYIQEFEDALNKAQDKIALELVPAFIADYQAAKDRAQHDKLSKGGLGPLYNPIDYPPEAEVEKLFGLEWQWLEIGVPEDMPAAMHEAAQAKWLQMRTDAAQEVRDGLRAALAGFVSHLVERLTVQPGEKPKIFRDTVVGNIQGFLEVFEAKNIMNDTELATLVGKARNLIQDVNPDKLREFSNVREATLTGFSEIKAQLDLMISEQKGRVFDLAED